VLLVWQHTSEVAHTIVGRGGSGQRTTVKHAIT
jgi:hypothetical protein